LQDPSAGLSGPASLPSEKAEGCISFKCAFAKQFSASARNGSQKNGMELAEHRNVQVTPEIKGSTRK